MTGSAVIDHAVLDALLDALGAGPDFLDELLQTFFDDSLQQIAAMRAGASTGDVESLRRAAHSLKSTSNTLGATRLAASCQEMEAQARANNLDRAGDRIAQIEAEYTAVVSELKTLQIGARGFAP